MLGFFRNLTKSKWGLAILFLFLAVIAFAFAAGDITGLRQGGTAVSSKTLATVGKRSISEAEVRARIEERLTLIRRQGQPVTMEQFLAQGGFEAVLDDTINRAAMEEFGQQTGLQVSRALIDGEIASDPAFQGPDGKFSQKKFESLLADVRIPPAKLRADATTERYQRWLVARVAPTAQVPVGVVNIYASLMLERRQGSVTLIPAASMAAGPDPDDKALTAFYNANRARYLLPARRVLRYATVTPARFAASSVATDADITAAYRAAGTRYAATEKRNVELVTAFDQTTAAAVANKAKAGSLSEAASSSGLTARVISEADKAALTQQVSAALANAAFSAAPDQLVGPTRLGPSWFVFRVTKVETIAARPLESVRAELAAEVTKRKIGEAVSEFRQKIEDDIGDEASFDDLANDHKLQGARTPAVTATGTDPEAPGYTADAQLLPIIRGGFAIDTEHPEPSVVVTADDGSFAVVALDRSIPAAPRPLTQIRDQVLADFHADKRLQAARAAAQAAVAKVNGGTPLAQALAGTNAGSARNFDLKGSDVYGQQQPQPEIVAAFSMAAGKAKLVAAPDRTGFYVVHVGQIEQHDASTDAPLIARTRAALAERVRIERAQQFIESVRKQLKMSRNDAAIAAFKKSLAGGGDPAAQ